MAIAVIAEIGAAVRIVAAEAPHAVIDGPAAALRLAGDDRAEHQPANNAGGDARAIVAAIVMSVAAAIAAPILNGRDQRFVPVLRLRSNTLRHRSAERRRAPSSSSSSSSVLSPIPGGALGYGDEPEVLANLRATVAAARAGRDGGWEAAWARTVAPLFGGVK